MLQINVRNVGYKSVKIVPTRLAIALRRNDESYSCIIYFGLQLPAFFSAIRAFTQLELMRTEELIENWYEESEKFVSTRVLVTLFWNTLDNR